MEENTEKKPVLLKENSLAVLPVVRTSSFGAFLSAGTGDSTDDILLHKAQQTEPVKIGDRVKVFLYHDPHHRLTASMRLPQIEVGQIGYVKVLLVTKFGAFVDVGTERGIFLPHKETIGRVVPDQYIWVKLYEDKTGRLAVTMHVADEMQELAHPCHGIKVGGKIQGTVYNMTREGAFIITREKWIAFLYRDDMPADLKMGQEVTAHVTYIRPDGHMNVSLRPQKEKAMESDMEKLVHYMEIHGGSMRLTDKSSPDDIRLALQMSKAAFKRAIGHLLKEKKIRLEDDRTVLL
jgi:predicted RNA-binding protein (virulence factor B family)